MKTYNLELTADQAMALDRFLSVVSEESCGSESDQSAIFDMLKITADHGKEIMIDAIEAVRSYISVITSFKENGSDLNEIQDKVNDLI